MHPRQLARRAGAAPVPRLGDPCASCEVREISVCGSLAPDELERLRAILATVHCEAGHAVIHEGDAADSVYNVVSGTLKLYKLMPDGRRLITGFLVAGDFLGIAFNDTYAYAAEAITLAHLCRFPRRRREALLSEMPTLERRLLGEAANELVAAQDQMLLLGRKTARERVASFLVGLARRAARHGRPDNPLAVPMSRTDIADYLGLTIETVSRTLSGLKRAGILDAMERDRIEILRRDALEALMEAG